MQDDETGSEPQIGHGLPAGGGGEPAGTGGGWPAPASGSGEPPGADGGWPAPASGDGETARSDGGWPTPAGGSGEPPGADDGWPVPAGGSGEPPRRRKRGRVIVYALVAVLAAGLGAAATVGLNSNRGVQPTGVSSHQIPGPQNDTGGGGTLRTSYVAAKVDPGVVDIDAAIAYSDGTSSEGTGMVITADGLVLTNNHVINGSKVIRVRLVTGTGKEYTADVVGYDVSHDVALLKLVGASDLSVVAVGNSAQVTLGTEVAAIGNAEGQGGIPRLAEGVINSLNKTISPTDESTGATETLHGMLQTNADIVSGDSGGPLVNAAGQVIGMDTANASSTQSTSSVLGYAIPINTALAVAHQIATGQASATVQIGLPGFLGVLVPQSNSASPQRQAQQQRQQEQQQGQEPGSSPGPGEPQGGSQGCTTVNSGTLVPSAIAPVGSGVLVDGVLCGTAAVTAGLASGDVITTVNGQAVTTPGSLTATMNGSRPGAMVTLSWETAGGQRETQTVALGTAPAK